MIRKATIKDIKVIHEILSDYGKQGQLLPRPLSELYDHVRDFSVFMDPKADRVVACCALQFCWEDLAEIRSLAVKAEWSGQNIGGRLLANALDEAREYRIKKLFTLTYRPTFFQKFGFETIDRNELPLKIWADCILCVKFPDCDETAMMKNIYE